MELNRLLELLDIEDPREFEYFENFVDLLELEGEIPPETIYQLLLGTSMQAVGEFVEEYFEDLLEHLPEDEAELYTLMETIKRSLAGLAKQATGEKRLIKFSNELYRFRNWYRFESIVDYEDGQSRRREAMPLFEAIVLYRSSRLEKRGEAEGSYDFEGCLDYPLEEYSMSFSEGPEDSWESDAEEDEE